MALERGYLLPTREHIRSGKNETASLLGLAERAEHMGLDGIWIGDSLTARPRHEPRAMLAAVERVLVDCEARQSCDIPLSAVGSSAVVTIEGLSADGVLHPLQRAFLSEQAAQCGFCTAGIVIAAKALLDANPRPGEREIRAALQDNLCRCGSHVRALRAVVRASEEMSR